MAKILSLNVGRKVSHYRANEGVFCTKWPKAAFLEQNNECARGNKLSFGVVEGILLVGETLGCECILGTTSVTKC